MNEISIPVNPREQILTFSYISEEHDSTPFIEDKNGNIVMFTLLSRKKSGNRYCYTWFLNNPLQEEISFGWKEEVHE